MTSKSLVPVRDAVIELIRTESHDGFSGMGPTDVRNLADRIAGAVVRYDEAHQVEHALTITTTVGSVKRATVGNVLSLLDAGFIPMQAHCIVKFASEVGITVDLARIWLKRFDVDLTDEDEIDDAIITTGDAIRGYLKRANSEMEKAADRDANNAAIMDALLGIAEARVITSLDRLVEVFD